MAPSTPPPPSSVSFGGVDDRVDLERGDVGDDDREESRRHAGGG
jgi:hypothetical protein